MSQEKPPEPAGTVSSFFGAIKGALFDDESKTMAPAKQTAPATAAPVAKTALPIGQPNPMVDNMMGIVMSKTTAFTALVEALTPLEQYIPDEGARFKAAFAIVGKTRTLEQIVQAIDLQHMQALEGEVQNFNSQAKSQATNEVQTRQREIAALQEVIRTNNDEAERIRKQAENRLVELATASAEAAKSVTQKELEISEKNETIARVNAQFKAAVETVKSTLVDAKAKVLRHLSA